jgi:hypothetical protein
VSQTATMFVTARHSVIAGSPCLPDRLRVPANRPARPFPGENKAGPPCTGGHQKRVYGKSPPWITPWLGYRNLARLGAIKSHKGPNSSPKRLRATALASGVPQGLATTQGPSTCLGGTPEPVAAASDPSVQAVQRSAVRQQVARDRRALRRAAGALRPDLMRSRRSRRLTSRFAS